MTTLPVKPRALMTMTYITPSLPELPAPCVAEPQRRERRESNGWHVATACAAVVILVSCAIQPVPSQSVADGQAHADVASGSATQASAYLGVAIGAMPDNETPVVRTNVTEAKVEVDGIPSQLEKAKTDFAAAQKQIDGDAAKILKLNNEISSSDRKAWLLLELVCAIVVGVGVAGAIVGGAYLGSVARGIGTAIGVAGAVVGVLGMIIPTLQNLMPYIAGAIAVLVLSFIVWAVIKKRAAILQLVQTGEAAKQLLPAVQRQTVFGNGALPGAAATIQSASTETMVAAVRNSGAINTVPSLAAA